MNALVFGMKLIWFAPVELLFSLFNQSDARLAMPWLFTLCPLGPEFLFSGMLASTSMLQNL